MKGITPNIGRIIITISVILLLLVGVVWYARSYKLDLVVSTSYELPEENFNYNSVRTEKPQGVPYWIWLILPRLFPEYLPGSGGYVSLGVTWEGGQELPVGFSKQTVTLASLYTTDRQASKDKSEIVLEESSSQFNLQSYIKFLGDCASDPRFTADYLLQEIDNYYYHLSPLEKQLYRLIAIPQTREKLLQLKKEFA
jgi:hypothetical protein